MLGQIIAAVIGGTAKSGQNGAINANKMSDNTPIAQGEQTPEMQQTEIDKPENKNEENANDSSSSANLKSELIGKGISALMSPGGNAPQIQPQQVAGGQPIASDENGKCDIRKEMEGKDPIDIFAQIDAYLYKYKPEYQQEYAGTGMTNNEDNFGVMAQDLQANPITQAAVKEDSHGHLALDGSRLSSINTAMISELCKRIEDLESAIYGR